MSNPNTRFCAKESFDRGEKFLGTMTTVKCYLLIEYDEAWPKLITSLLDNSRIEDKVVKHLNEFIHHCPENVRVLFIKNSNSNVDKKVYLTRVLSGVAQVSEFNINSYRDILSIDLNSAYNEPKVFKNILVVCTHGKHDKCCAKFGYPIFQELSKWITLTGVNFEVWECSHVGGDRFAANVIWLPYGLGFGHVQLQDGEFIKKLMLNKIPLQYFRGCSIFPSAGQFLEGVVRKKYLLENPGGVEIIRYNENLYEERSLDANIEMRFIELENKSINATVRISRDTDNGEVLASCNEGGYAFPRSFKLIDNIDLRI
jgi:hypothetical protein